MATEAQVDINSLEEWPCPICDFTGPREEHNSLFCKNFGKGCPHLLGYQYNHLHCNVCEFVGPESQHHCTGVTRTPTPQGGVSNGTINPGNRKRNNLFIQFIVESTSRLFRLFY